jgi:hypothetical protein
MSKIAFRLAACLLLIRLSFPVGVVQGARQTSYSVTKNYIQPDFPDRLTFHLAAISSDTIESVTLLTGTNGHACQPSQARQSLDFTPGPHVDLTWDLDFRQSGLLPPGAEVWWQWIVTTSGGTTDTTPKKTYVVEDQRFNWMNLEKSGITLQWLMGDQAFGAALMDISLKSLQRLEKDMGISPMERIWITIYPSAAVLQEAAHAFEWTGGVAFPNYNSTMIGISPDEREWADQVIPHELSHLVVDVLVFNCHGVDTPTWLGEGLAVFAENQPLQLYKDLVMENLRKDNLPNLSSLSAGFSAYSDSASLSYAQSSQVVAFMIQDYGAQKMGELLDGLHAGETIDEALKRIYNLDTEGLDAAWRASLGFALQATSTMIPLEASSPTPVPTLALGTSPVKARPTASAIRTVTAVVTTQILPSPTVTPVPVPGSGLLNTPSLYLLVPICLGVLVIVVLAGLLLRLRLRKKQADL